MCGIAGFFGNKKKTPELGNIKKCLSLMKKRGPDNQDFILRNVGQDNKLVLLHSRLSIIDAKKKSDQPMEDKRGIVSFNGEIYNYIELKKKIKEKFTTNSDTEVLLKTFANNKKLDDLDGMWSFAYFDKFNDNLYLVTDPFNEKPLYYYKEKDFIFFGSCPSYIFALSNLVSKIDEEKTYFFLKYGFKYLNYSENTFHQNIFKLENASMIKFNRKSFSKKKYWYLPYSKNFKITYEDAVEKTRLNIINSFNKRFRSDFNIACLLSGGIDSAIIASLGKKNFKKDISYYSIKANSKIYDESDRINEIVKKYNLKHKYVKISKKNNIKYIEKIIRETYSPISSISYLVYAKLNEIVHNDGYKVVLTGLGGDEIFGGYYTHQLNFLKSIKSKKNFFDESLFNWRKYTKPLIRSKTLSSLSDYEKILISKNPSFHEAHSISKYIKKSEYIFSQKHKKQKFDFFKSMLLNDLFKDTVPPQLLSSDQISMFYSVENRSPFLSRNVLEDTMRFPTSYFIRNGYTKSLLRDAFRDLLPEKIVNFREKIGFNITLNECFESSSKEFRDYLFQNERVNRLIYVDKINNILKNNMVNNAEQKLIFNMINIVALFKIQ